MALTAIASTVRKAISFKGASSSAVLYTVPAGKTFVGMIYAQSSSSYININGVSWYPINGTSNAPTMPAQVTFPAGTVFTDTSGSANSLLVFGYES